MYELVMSLLLTIAIKDYSKNCSIDGQKRKVGWDLAGRLLSLPEATFFCQVENLRSLIKKSFPAMEKPACDSAGARTQDPLIKSQVLYQLSYEIIKQKWIAFR